MDNSHSESLHGHESAQMAEYVDAKENFRASSPASSQRNEVEQEGVQVAKKTKNQKMTPEERIERRNAAERARYHRMNPEQKKAYKEKRAERKKLRRAEGRGIHSAQLTDAQREERNEKQRKKRAEKARKQQDLDPCGFFAQMEKKIARQTDKAIKKISEN
ncbi:hypothetical protein CAEBREN_08761 [Caenorhabditis brenneri]|uniref:Uncharacterized protein n=1 Tax=Caenorhabditis brenneri TaxID=135651 RepID=G0NC49_CAEBE|nr:hypothetical protein CAEBREN_08761 [Caenorhabditis brenneri]